MILVSGTSFTRFYAFCGIRIILFWGLTISYLGVGKFFSLYLLLVCFELQYFSKRTTFLHLMHLAFHTLQSLECHGIQLASPQRKQHFSFLCRGNEKWSHSACCFKILKTYTDGTVKAYFWKEQGRKRLFWIPHYISLVITIRDVQRLIGKSINRLIGLRSIDRKHVLKAGNWSTGTD